MKTGSRTVKCVTGYNLTGLLVGSEGTLGVISEIILKLIPLPQTRKAMLATFGDVAQASETVAAIIANRIVPATLEFMDNFTIRTVEDLQPRRAAGGGRGPPAHRGGRPPRGGGGGGRQGGGHLPPARRHRGARRQGRRRARPGLERPARRPFRPWPS